MVVGLTGGIGSGKSTVLEMFRELGVPVFIADVEAKKLMHTSIVLKKEICALLGDESYKNNTLNRAYIADIVFNNPEKLKELNAIVHPKVHQVFQDFLKEQTASYTIYESAILFENKKASLCDKTVLVVAPIEIRVERVLKRDNSTSEQVYARINNQLPDEDKIVLSDFIIHNIDIFDTKKEVLKLHNELLLFKK